MQCGASVWGRGCPWLFRPCKVLYWLILLGVVVKVSAVAEHSDDISVLSFESALAELDQIVRSLEGGATKLDDSIAAYERGEMLKRHCEAKLREARMRVDRIVLGADGSALAEPADIQ